MSTFTSVFSSEIKSYLALREKTLTNGSYKYACGVLASFDACLAELNPYVKTITEEMITAWIRRLSAVNTKRTVRDKISCLRKFLEFLRYNGFLVFMPKCPKHSDHYVPYIFSNEEMVLIMQTADAIEPKQNHPAGRCLSMLLRVLYGCGLRLGEALVLRVGDVNFKRGFLFLRQPKNKKQRIVPMHETLTKMLWSYCSALEIADRPEAFVFPGLVPESHISGNAVLNRFHNVLKSSGIYVKPAPHERGQCLHCLRHLFAIRSFAQAEQNGHAVTDSVPYLSVYLGHYDMDGTEKYLKFSSDIFPEHTQMFEAYCAEVFTVLGGGL